MKKTLIILSYLLSPVALGAAIMAQNMDKYSMVQYFLPMSLGVLSYTWLLWQFVLSARPRFIEKHFGLDKMYRFHGIIALVALLGVVLHKVLYELIFPETFMTELGTIALVLFAGVSALSIVFMSTKLVSAVPVIRVAVDWVKKLKGLTYERLKLIHNMTWVAMILMQVHVLMTGSARSSQLVFNLYMIYFFIGMGFYIYHKAYKPWLLSSKRYRVDDLVRESEDVWTLHLVSKIGRNMVYKPGQFGFFTIFSEGIPQETHPFSISSTPTDPSKLTVTIKALGDFTQAIVKVKPGDEVMIEGPFGNFSYLNYKHEKATVFVAGGVGITPALSMIKHMHQSDPKRHVTLIWGVRTAQDLIQQRELLDFEKTMPNFRWIPVVSNDNTWAGRKGYIDAPVLQEILEAHHDLDGSTGFFICGPPVMMEAAQKNLMRMGIPKKQIHFENFSA